MSDLEIMAEIARRVVKETSDWGAWGTVTGVSPLRVTLPTGAVVQPSATLETITSTGGKALVLSMGGRITLLGTAK